MDNLGKYVILKKGNLHCRDVKFFKNKIDLKSIILKNTPKIVSRYNRYIYLNTWLFLHSHNVYFDRIRYLDIYYFYV